MLIRNILPRPAGFLGMALLLTALGGGAPARADQSDAVQAVERALMQPLPNTTNAKEVDDALAARKKRLTEVTDDKSGLTSLSDMALALLLPNWSDESTSRSDSPDTSRIDHDVRLALLQRMLAAVKAAIKGGQDNDNPDLRAAVATLVGEFSASARSGFLGARSGNGLVIAGLPGFAEVLAGLAKSDKSPEVRSAAARALAKVRSAPDVTVQGLEAMLKDSDVTVRRSAAAALAGLLRGTQAADRGGFAAPIVDPSPDSIVDFGPKVAAAAGAVLNGSESDAHVRRLAADAILQVATIVNNQLRSGSAEFIADLHKRLRPVVSALWDQVAALNRGALDPNPEVRQTALRAQEEMGDLRVHWLKPLEVLKIGPTPLPKPPVIKPKVGLALPLEAALLTDDPEANNLTASLQAAPKDDLAPLTQAIPALVRALGDPLVTNRLAAVDALETITARTGDQTVAQELGKESAATAAKALTRALSDPDRFVRWAAARTLGEMAPLDDADSDHRVEQGAVGALARLLSDAIPDVRLRVAIALERFGKAARAAAPALARASSRGDLEARIAAAHALEVIGGSPDVAVPALADGLRDSYVRLRRASAEALAAYGAQARPAQPALNRALRDSDPEVRRLASDALIKIGLGK